MSKLSPEEVGGIARLARLGVSAEALQTTAESVSDILELVDQLQAAQTQDTPPTSQVTGLTDVLRPDRVEPSSIPPAELVARAPRHEGSYIVVKRVLQ